MKPTKMLKRDAQLGPNCTCTAHWDETGRFPTWRITAYSRKCINHGYLFAGLLAANLRYGD